MNSLKWEASSVKHTVIIYISMKPSNFKPIIWQTFNTLDIFPWLANSSCLNIKYYINNNNRAIYIQNSLCVSKLSAT